MSDHQQSRWTMLRYPVFIMIASFVIFAMTIEPDEEVTGGFGMFLSLTTFASFCWFVWLLLIKAIRFMAAPAPTGGSGTANENRIVVNVNSDQTQPAVKEESKTGESK